MLATMEVDNNVELLWEAVEQNDKSSIESLLKIGVNLNEIDRKTGFNCLHMAVKIGKIDTVRVLLSAGQSIINDLVCPGVEKDKVSFVGYAALHLCIEFGHMRIFELLLSSGGDVDVAAGGSNMTPLHLACRKGYMKFVKCLLKYNSRIDVEDVDGRSVLTYAVEYNHVEALRFLLNNGFDVKGDPYLMELLKLAVINECVDIVKFLLRTFTINLTEPVLYGRTLLHLAVLPRGLVLEKFVAQRLKRDKIDMKSMENKCAIVNMLLLENIDMYVKCDEDLMVLHVAAAVGYKNIVELLLKYWKYGGLPLVNYTTNLGKTPVTYAIECNNVEIVKLLIDMDVSIECCNFYGKSLLEIACSGRNMLIIRFLLSRFDYMKTYKDCFLKALHFSIFSKYVVVVEELLKQFGITFNYSDGSVIVNMSPVNVDNVSVLKCLLKYSEYRINLLDLKSVLDVAVGNNDMDMLDLFLKDVTNVNYKDSNGVPLLFLVCSVPNVKFVKRLLALGCDLHVRDNVGSTALHVAAETGNIQLIKLLLKCDCRIDMLDNMLCTPFVRLLKVLSGWKRMNNLKCMELSNDMFISIRNNLVNVAKLLINESDNIIYKEENGVPCVLHLAVKTGIFELVKMVLTRHPDLEHVDKVNLQRAVHIAAHYGYVDILQHLLNCGARPDVVDLIGESAVLLAIKNEQVEALRVLLRYTTCNDYKDVDSRTAMHLAASSGNIDLINVLARTGVDLHACDKFGKTPLCHAASLNKKCAFLHFFKIGFNVNYLTRKTICYCSKFNFGVRFIKMHLLKLNLAGCYLQDDLLDVVETTKTIACPKVVKPIASFKLEVECLRSTLIPNTSIPYINVLDATDNRMAKLVTNIQVHNMFVNDFMELRKQFPNYWRLLFAQFIKGTTRRRLIDKSTSVLLSGLLTNDLPMLPHYCVSVILSYLSNSDLHLLSTLFPNFGTDDNYEIVSSFDEKSCNISICSC